MRVRRHQNGLCAESGTEQRSAPGIWADYDEYMESSFIGMMGAEDETGEEICTGMMM